MMSASYTMARMVLRTTGAILAAVLLLPSCSADYDTIPGFCAIDCAKAKIAGNEMEINFIGFSPTTEAGVTIHCQAAEAGTEYPKSIPIRFQVDRAAVGADLSPRVPASPATAAKESTRTPVSNISFEALILTGSTSGDNESDDASIYRGIETPQDLWCTDSCGVGVIDIKPLCQANSEDINVLIRSGSVGKVFKIKVEKN